MSRSRIAGLLVATILAACTIERGDVRTPGGESPEADTVRVRKAIEAIAHAFESGDLTGLDTIYHDSVTVFEAGTIDQGWVKYRNGRLTPEIEAIRDRQLLLDDIQVHLAGTTAWASCQYTLTGYREGEPISELGVATMVFRKSAGRWRLVVSHTSSRDLAEAGS
jgi:ketosteroid isomerase-like protein